MFFLLPAPEVLNEEPAFQQSDMWSVGVITYLLMSGVSPFRGADDEETKCNITYERYRFDHLHQNRTPELTRFLLFVFKRAPNKRPTVEECLENRWLQATDFMIRKREIATFSTQKIKVNFMAWVWEKEIKILFLSRHIRSYIMNNEQRRHRKRMTLLQMRQQQREHRDNLHDQIVYKRNY